MLQYILRRLLGAIPTLILVIALAFLLVHAAPGGPFDDPRGLDPKLKAQLEAYYHLDKPLIQQFLIYLGNLARGDFGPSFRYTDQTVSQLIADAFPVSLLVGGLAMLLAVAVGVAAGTWAALRRNTLTDRVVTGLSMTGISIPVFVVAPFGILVLAVWCQLLPAGWSGSHPLARLVLPVTVLALPQIAYIARLTRAGMIDVLASPFIRTARAQGLGEWSVVRYHALRPALLPVISYLGPAIAGILTGSIVVEQIFGIPGLGRHFVDAALVRDYTRVLGVVVLYASLIVLLNLIVDILYGLLDPRVRYR